MSVKHVIVDGSNIATEGRDAPSLAQLDEAVTAFIEEYSPTYVTVVVDATFPNRIDRKERKKYEDAVNANELITPPAGAIGRGDAFILQIARRANASILSNDSFQEFHGEYPWLFDKGRLIGGKPVPHVGWVFMDRAPVRGPTSRRAVSEARKVAKAAVKAADKAVAAAEQATAADRAAAGVTAAEGDEPPAEAPRKRRTRKAAAASAAPSEPAAEEAPAKAPAKAPARRRTRKAAAAPAAEMPATPDGAEPPAAAAPDGAEVPAAEPAGDAGRAKGVEPYNEALPFIEFVGRHPVGSEVDAVVERFSSHGAYVLVGAARAYLPLRNLAHPAPRSAKEVLQVGEERRFVVVAIDPPRRGIDLAVPGVVEVPAPSVAAAASDAPAAGDAPPEGAVGRKAARRTPAATSAPARKAAAKKAAARKAAGKKAGATEAADVAPPATEPAAKEPSVTRAAARKSAKKAAARKATATKATAKKAAAKKAASKKAAASEASTRKAASKKATASKASTRKAAKQATAGAEPAKAAVKSASAKRTGTRRAAANRAAAAGAPADEPKTTVVDLPGEAAGGRGAGADPARAEAASG